jgi:hypothetical protein
VYWSQFNEDLIVAFESGWVRKYNPKTGEERQGEGGSAKLHEEKINMINWDANKVGREGRRKGGSGTIHTHNIT